MRAGQHEVLQAGTLAARPVEEALRAARRTRLVVLVLRVGEGAHARQEAVPSYHEADGALRAHQAHPFLRTLPVLLGHTGAWRPALEHLKCNITKKHECIF